MYLIYMSTLSMIFPLCLVMGIFVYHNNKKSRTNRIFTFNCLLLACIILIDFLLQLSGDKNTAVRIQGLYNVFFFLFLMGSLYFYLTFSRQNMKKTLHVVIWLTFLLQSVLFVIAPDRVLELSRTEGFWVYGLKQHAFWYLFYTPFLVLMAGLMFYFLLRYLKKETRKRIRKQTRIMFYATLAAYGTGYVMLMIFPTMSRIQIPLLTPYFFALYLFGIYHAITKYKLMNNSLEDLASTALSMISDYVILLTPDLAILGANKNFVQLVTSGQGSQNENNFIEPNTSQEKMVLGQSFSAYLNDSNHVLRYIKDLSQTKNNKTEMYLEIKGSAKILAARARFMAIYDEFGDLTAVLLTCSEKKGFEQFEKTYKLTKREIQIIFLVLQGTTSKQIASDLLIAERTVETHLNNIYNKTSVNNKIELLRLITDYNLA